MGNNRGITIVETIVAIAVFSLVTFAALGVFKTAQSLATKAAQKEKAVWLAEEGIEAARSIRDRDFTLLTTGAKGLAIASGQWQFSGTQDTTDIYTRSLSVTGSGDSRQVQSNVQWNYKGASSSVALSETLTNWRRSSGMGNAVTVATSSAYLSLSNSRRLLTGITLTNDGSAGTTTITSITATWSIGGRQLQQVRSPNGSVVWSGSATTGSMVTLTTPIALSGSTSQGFELYFNNNMNGSNFTITFTFSDSSSKSVTLNAPPTGV